jgi:ABC-type multidrug transport system permease subunit
MVFGGFYLNASSIGPWFIWIHYISFYKYGFEALMWIEFKDRVFTCLDSEYLVLGAVKICPITSGNQVIANNGIQNSNVWICFGMLVAMGVVTRMFAYLLLRFRQKPVIKR